ncbi:MAG: GGDEF domain-containing protein [Pseudomonadota bacterium]
MPEQQVLDRWLRVIAAEVMTSLRKVREQKQPLTEEILALTLSSRPDLMELINSATPENGPQGDSSKKELFSEDISLKYKAALEELRHAENQCDEVETSFKPLVLTLANLARDPNVPGLDHELNLLKQTLRQKAVAGRLESSNKKLKNFILHAEEGVEAKPDEPGGPESIEDNIRDILILLVKDITVLEDVEVQKKSQLIIRKIRTDFTLDDFEPFIHDVQDLILQIKQTVRREKYEIYKFTQEIIDRLDDTEKDLARNIDSTSLRLGPQEREFHVKVDRDIQGIEKSFEGDDLTIGKVRSRVLDKIASIREHFRQKREEDEARLRTMAEEKAGIENRLQDIHQRYQEFARRSKAMLEEMEKFRQASIKDALTGAYNRRAYDFQIKKALESLRKGELTKFALIIFDIDHFKDFNNNYGHRAGDKILAHVAKFAGGSLRKEDFLARYGGDEFAIILPEVNLKNGAKLAEQIRSGINQVEFKIYRDSDIMARVGLSMGVAVGRTDDNTGSVFSRADKALYLSKQKGRNQVRTEKDK